MANDKKIWLITGVSRGLGKALAQAVLDKGDVGKVVQYLANINGKQLGDPDLGAQAKIKAVEAENPPLHLVLRSDALKRIQAKIQSLISDLNAWKDVSKSTDFRDMVIHS